MIWKSVVGKLWATILLFFSFVLFVLTLLLMQFISNYVVNQVTDGLTNTASKISITLEQHDDIEFGLEVVWEILDDVTNAIIITDENHIYYSNPKDNDIFDLEYFLNDRDLSQVINEKKSIQKDIFLQNVDENGNKSNQEAIIVGVPLDKFSNQIGAVYIYQSLDVMRETSKSITKLIFAAAFIAFILTTVFAFFLSTRISAPLIRMKEAAFEVQRGNFDIKVPVLTNDEIGQLGIAFNEMRKKLRINMNDLKQEKEQLKSVLSTMADGVFMFDTHGHIKVTNPPAKAFLHLWNYEKEDALFNEVPIAVMELFDEVIRSGKEQVGEIELQGRHWTMIVSPLYNGSDIRGAVTVLRDMTEERIMDKLRKDFLANVSHELRTPISMLQGYSEALTDGVVQSEEERIEIAKIINEESQRIGRLVNELLDLARMESGFSNLNKQWISLQPFLEKIVKKFNGLAKENGIELTLSTELKNEEFYFDPDRIEQVLTNLIDNGIRHTSSGGKIQVVATEEQNNLILEVIDNGSGIPSEDIPFVFERFYKADKARTRGRSGNGTGLGLSIAKNIVKSHSGQIGVKSKLGQGTTFTVVLPRNS